MSKANKALWAGIGMMGVFDRFREKKVGEVVQSLPATIREDLKELRAEDMNDRLDIVLQMVDDSSFDQHGHRTGGKEWIHDLLKQFDRTMLAEYHREKGITCN